MKALDPARHREVMRIFGDTLGLPQEKRSSHLQEACSHDASLRREIESLLKYDYEGDADFLDKPASRILTPWLDDSYLR